MGIQEIGAEAVFSGRTLDAEPDDHDQTANIRNEAQQDLPAGSVGVMQPPDLSCQGRKEDHENHQADTDEQHGLATEETTDAADGHTQ